VNAFRVGYRRRLEGVNLIAMQSFCYSRPVLLHGIAILPCAGYKEGYWDGCAQTHIADHFPENGYCDRAGCVINREFFQVTIQYFY